MNYDLLYIKSNLLIDELNQLEFGITKQAGVFDDLWSQLNGSVAGVITNAVKDHFQSDAPGGWFTGFMSLLSAGVLWNIHPLLGVLYTVANELGFNFTDIVKKIFNILKPKLDNNQPISSADVVKAGEEAAGISVEAFYEDFEQLIKKARMYATAGFFDEIDALRSNKNQSRSLSEKIFGNALKAQGKGKVRKIMVGLVIWLVKTMLKSVGILAIGGAALSLLGLKRKEEESKSTESENKIKDPSEIDTTTKTWLPPKLEKKYWVVPILGNIENTLKIWAQDLYSELKSLPNLDQLLNESIKFKETVDLLTIDPSKYSAKQLLMPTQFKNRKEVVDNFIDDILLKIQQ